MAQGQQIDQSTYETARGYLKAALEQMIAAGRNVKEFGEFSLEKFGDTFVPYLNEFSDDISKGSIKIKGLGQSAKTTLFGHHVTLEQREQMIREAAYLRAERRGFAGGSEHEDWLAAEREVDKRLAQETGLVEKGREVVTSVSTTIEQEFDDIKHVVAGWLENNPEIGKKLGKVGKKAVAVKKAARSKPVAKASKKSGKEEKKAEKKTVAVKKAAKKKTVKKESVNKKAARKKAVKKKAAKKTNS